MTLSTGTLDRTQAELQLQRILSSPVFRNAHRSRRLLRYLLESPLAWPPIRVKEYTIAVDVFDRDSGYDPSVNATVRVEARRLRDRLREYYYEAEGRHDSLMIEVPKGSYAAVLRRRSSPQAQRSTR